MDRARLLLAGLLLEIAGRTLFPAVQGLRQRAIPGLDPGPTELRARRPFGPVANNAVNTGVGRLRGRLQGRLRGWLRRRGWRRNRRRARVVVAHLRVCERRARCPAVRIRRFDAPRPYPDRRHPWNKRAVLLNRRAVVGAEAPLRPLVDNAVARALFQEASATIDLIWALFASVFAGDEDGAVSFMLPVSARRAAIPPITPITQYTIDRARLRVARALLVVG